MDVSRKIIAETKQSLELYCLPCDQDGLKVSVHGYCRDCKEHLCKTCFENHTRPKPCRNHILLDINAMPDQLTTVNINEKAYSENCTNHMDKPLEFYCNNHKTVACYVCVALEHKECKAEYIPDMPGNVSRELKDLDKKMEVLVKRCESNIMKASAAKKQLEQSHRKVVEDIRFFRKEINDRLDQIESVMITEAEAVVNTANYKLENITVACEKLAGKVKRLQSFLNALMEESKLNKIFTELKNVGPHFMTLESEEIQIVKDNMAFDDIRFDRNGELLEQLKNENSFGTISTYRKPSADTEICVKYDRSLNVKFPSDKSQSNVVGMAMVSSTRMIIADYNNNKIKTIDVETGTLVSEKTLTSAPLDVTKLPENKLGVALPNEKCIQIMSHTDTSLPLDRRIDVGERFFCVAYCQDKLVVGRNCNPGKLVILDLDGQIIQVFDTPGLFDGPKRIVISRDEMFMYVSDYSRSKDSKCVKIDWEGNVVQRFEDQGCEGPIGVQELEDGTLLVCLYSSRKIVRLSSSFKECKITGLEDIDLSYQQIVTYSESNHKLYVSCSSEHENVLKHTIEVFKM
ncbi:uncharacterized protein LOC132727469 [Ruditapes philippinarum]|uniref:uncharacterized protein LOC132727469 n=1 Tax=Ruditapes philippinarum TaxID=129788 RepID=UPI00295AEC6A|nr:uncharacterized protein LOC132727469 [Ruditapes philippinarum]